MNRIREVRENKKISLKKTTELLKSNDLLTLTPDALAKYERGDRQPNETTWQALANFFNVSVPYLRGYMVCSRCQGYFIPENNIIREQIECCPYCMNPYFEGDKNEMEND